MPNYDFECTNQDCKEQFEEIVATYDTTQEVPCPKCSSPAKFIVAKGSRERVKYFFNWQEGT